MNRRSFFKGIAAMSLAGLIAAHFPATPPVQAAGKLYLGSSEGRIFESADGGQSWQPRADFGPGCSILEIWQDNHTLYARVSFEKRTFTVKSTDGRWWRTPHAYRPTL